MVIEKRKKAMKIIALILVAKIIKRKQIGRRPDTDSMLTGSAYLQEILYGNDAHCQETLRMSKQSFLELCDHFRIRGWLKNSRYLSVEEKMAMFLLTLSHNLRNRIVKRRFNHSTHTVHIYFHEVLVAMLKFSKEMIVSNTDGSNISQRHHNLGIFFQGAVGALDGTLISAVKPQDQQVPYRGRGKGECYQNVLAICDFDMIFTYVLAGWEGVAHDSRVLSDTINDPANNFPLPSQDKYYLCDAAYTHTRWFMTPYRNIRYWLSDFRRGGRARTREELFNQSHAKLRNVIERAFGVLKARFPILKKMAPYSFPVQRNIVIACAAIHNFIRRSKAPDTFFEQFNDVNAPIENAEQNDNNLANAVGVTSRIADQNFMINLREQIATQLLNSGIRFG